MKGYLSVVTVFNYLEASHNSRCIVEGERLLNANHVITLGTVECSEGFVSIFALCLQTSGLLDVPHEITGKLERGKGDDFKIASFKCTCKAGLSSSCKHSSAVLLKCTRFDNQCLFTLHGHNQAKVDY